MIKRLIEKLKTLRLYFVSKRYVKSWDEMTLFEQWQYARDNFQHYSIRCIYDTGDGFRRTVSSEEKLYCLNMANKWDAIIKELRLKIISKSNVC
jgi:hypothetical protein